MNAAQEFIYTRTYSRWKPEEKRRETWPETAQRYIDFMDETLPGVITDNNKEIALNHITQMHTMPSMRAMWAAGDAARNNHITCYNCAFVAVNCIQSFVETLFILMCGTGVGFSIEREYVDQLPEIKPRTGNTVGIQVEDSREGWANALGLALVALFNGDEISVDYSKVRPRGARLITMGGRASGPGPLRDLFEYLKSGFAEKHDKKQKHLFPIDCLDIQNKIAEIVVAGGVRRSSEISLSDLDDKLVSEAKMGEFWTDRAHRAMSNNSAVYDGLPDINTFLEQFNTLIKSKAGERGIFNREGARKQMVMSGRRKDYPIIGCNPCAEILLRDQEFCNLSEVVVRAGDSLESLRRKVKVAVMFGCWQATLTKFPLIRQGWADNCNEERLLGVSLTGIMDNPVLNNVSDRMKRWLSDIKGVAISETEKWCKKLDINMSAAITTGKPSGTVSQLVDCASGIHQRYANYYIRRYRIAATDPLFRMMVDQGVPYQPEVGQDADTASTMVLDFPYAAPKGAKTRHDFTAMQQLEHWKAVKDFWCEHNQSITVYVGENEWMDTAAWVYNNFDDVCGISFLPKSNHVYMLAPYEEINKDQYKELATKFPKIDYTQLSKYELEDNTLGSKTYACVGGACDAE